MKNSFEVKEAKRKRTLSLRQGNKMLGGGNPMVALGDFFFKLLIKGLLIKLLTFLSFLSESFPPREGEKEDEKAHRKCK